MFKYIQVNSNINRTISISVSIGYEGLSLYELAHKQRVSLLPYKISRLEIKDLWILTIHHALKRLYYTKSKDNQSAR